MDLTRIPYQEQRRVILFERVKDESDVCYGIIEAINNKKARAWKIYIIKKNEV